MTAPSIHNAHHLGIANNIPMNGNGKCLKTILCIHRVMEIDFLRVSDFGRTNTRHTHTHTYWCTHIPLLSLNFLNARGDRGRRLHLHWQQQDTAITNSSASNIERRCTSVRCKIHNDDNHEESESEGERIMCRRNASMYRYRGTRATNRRLTDY